jgi:probable phosphoglycerate mutase
MTHRPTEIWLIRHGETAWSRTGQHTGRTDLPLTERGADEARAVSALLENRPFARVLCSPLQRAKQTCEIAGYLEEAVIDPRVMEWDYGTLNGRTAREVRDELGADWNIWKGPVPNGETVEDVAARASEVLRDLTEVDGPVAIFAHGHFLRIFTATFLEMPPRAAKNFALHTARACVLGWERDFPVIQLWNHRI